MNATAPGTRMAALLGIAALLSVASGHALAQDTDGAPTDPIEIKQPAETQQPAETEQPAETQPPAVTELGRGIASWYGAKFHGRRTSSGERFDMNSLTAAHKTLPLGTKVRVRNEANGREVVVRINDRAPGIRGRIIDLSKAAAAALGFVKAGEAHVVLFGE